MAKEKKIINPGGVNGSGKGVVNTNSKEFKALRKAIVEHSKKQSPEDKIKIKLFSLKLQMESYVNKTEPNELINAGKFLSNHLKAIKVKNKVFAKYIDLEESNLSSIIKGRRKINTDLAFKLGQIFDLDPNLWLLIQSKNELLQVDRKKIINYKKYKLEELLKKVS